MCKHLAVTLVLFFPFLQPLFTILVNQWQLISLTPPFSFLLLFLVTGFLPKNSYLLPIACFLYFSFDQSFFQLENALVTSTFPFSLAITCIFFDQVIACFFTIYHSFLIQFLELMFYFIFICLLFFKHLRKIGLVHMMRPIEFPLTFSLVNLSFLVFLPRNFASVFPFSFYFLKFIILFLVH